MVERYGVHRLHRTGDQPTYGMAPRAAEIAGVPMDALPELDPAPLEAEATLRFGDP